MGYSGQRRPPPACWRASPLSPWRFRRSPLGVLSSEPSAAPHVSPVPYRLIQEPDAGYQPIIDLIRSAVSSVRMTTDELAEDDAVTALADAHRRGVDVKVILDPHSTVSTPTRRPTMRFTPPASTSNGRPMMRSTTRNPSSSTTLSPPSVPETSPRSTTRPRPMPTFSPPAPATSSPSPPPSTPISPTSTSPGPSECPFGHRVGGCAIHVPAVVCANSPSRPTAYASVGVAGTDAVFSTSRVAPDDRLAGAQDATCPESPCYRPAYPIRPLTKPDSLVCLYLVVATKKCLPRTRRTPSVAPPRFYCRAWDRCRRSRSVGISVTSANRRPTDAARNGQVRPDQPAGSG